MLGKSIVEIGIWENLIDAMSLDDSVMVDVEQSVWDNVGAIIDNDVRNISWFIE